MLLVRPQPAPVSKVEISPFGVSFAPASAGLSLPRPLSISVAEGALGTSAGIHPNSPPS
jgi:hypothetical protein